MTATVVPATPSPTPVLLTAAEFTTRYANKHAELIKGIVKENPVPMPQHGYICSTINLVIPELLPGFAVPVRRLFE